MSELLRQDKDGSLDKFVLSADINFLDRECEGPQPCNVNPLKHRDHNQNNGFVLKHLNVSAIKKQIINTKEVTLVSISSHY